MYYGGGGTGYSSSSRVFQKSITCLIRVLKGMNGLLDKPHYNWYEYLVIVILCLLFLIYLEFF